jgi:hypothetical protein
MIESIRHSSKSSDPADMDPAILADIANKAGCACAEEVKEEMRGLGMQLDQINRGIESLGDRLVAMNEKIDRIGNKMDEQRHLSQMTLETVKNAGAESRQLQHQTLEMIMAMAERSGSSIPVVFSEIEDAQQLSERAKGAYSNVMSFDSKSGNLLCHSAGFGSSQSELRLNGEHGYRGATGGGGMMDVMARAAAVSSGNMVRTAGMGRTGSTAHMGSMVRMPQRIALHRFRSWGWRGKHASILSTTGSDTRSTQLFFSWARRGRITCSTSC